MTQLKEQDSIETILQAALESVKEATDFNDVTWEEDMDDIDDKTLRYRKFVSTASKTLEKLEATVRELDIPTKNADTHGIIYIVGQAVSQCICTLPLLRQIDSKKSCFLK